MLLYQQILPPRPDHSPRHVLHSRADGVHPGYAERVPSSEGEREMGVRV